MVRQQNVHAGALAFEKGDKVGVLFGADAARVLRD